MSLLSDDVPNCLINRTKSLSAGPISLAGENQQEENESVRNPIQLINPSYLIHHALPSSKRECFRLRQSSVRVLIDNIRVPAHIFVALRARAFGQCSLAEKRVQKTMC